VDPQGEVLVEVPPLLRRLVLHRVNTCGVGLGLSKWPVGLLAAADCVDPRLEREVVLEERPGQPWPPPSLPRLSRKPSGPRATLEFLYQSGMLSFWRERWTRSWCSDMTRSPPPPFCSSFSGGIHLVMMDCVNILVPLTATEVQIQIGWSPHTTQLPCDTYSTILSMMQRFKRLVYIRTGKCERSFW